MVYPQEGDLFLVTKKIPSKWNPPLDLFPDDVLIYIRITKWDPEYLFMYAPRLDKELPYNINVVQMCMKRVG